ncbi:MAG: DegT/DnrJ/EryC1/StrS family aminotransferase [Bacteroidota bacterium]
MSDTLTSPIRMVDLHGQYLAIKEEVDAALSEVLTQTSFINGPAVRAFECDLAGYLDGPYTLGVANGTDALQIAMMALGIGPGDEVITTAFTFIATAEAAALLGATPVFADIEPDTFNIDPAKIEALITERTKAIVPVHLFGQPADLDPMLALGKTYGIPIIEDTAQAIGAEYKGCKVGFLGDIGTLSFFPSKNLGCYGDGGAVLTPSAAWFEAMKLVANHGSKRKYFNEVVGINSRLDAMQAAILGVKLKYLDQYIAARRAAANRYDALLGDVEALVLPHRAPDRTHVFHQYTLRVTDGQRDALSAHLKTEGIPHAIYYPKALHQLPVFADGPAQARWDDLTETIRASGEVLSLPMHTELDGGQQSLIAEVIRRFFA